MHVEYVFNRKILLSHILAVALLVATKDAVRAQHSADAERIVFHSSVDGRTQIYVMNDDGSNRTRLTDNSYSDVAPQISPDGSEIAFVSDRDGVNHVYLMDLNGANQRRLTSSPQEEGEPTWSPNGSRIYYRQAKDNGSVVLCAVGSDGHNFSQLTDGSTRYLRSQVSPDGTQILAIAVGGGFELRLMDGDGSNQRQFPNAARGVAFASWSPDGRKIVFATATPPPNPGADIFVINADGTGYAQLTHAQGVSEYPCWSPDGEEIAFQTSRDGNFEIYVMQADGSGLRRLTDYPGLDGRPSWGAVRP